MQDGSGIDGLAADKIEERRIADRYTWPAKVRQILGVYQSVCKSPEAAPGAVLSAEELCQG